MPALLTSTSTGAELAESRDSVVARDVELEGDDVEALAAERLGGALRLRGVRPLATTRCPSRASWRAVSYPRPRFAPVTSAVRPSIGCDALTGRV